MAGRIESSGGSVGKNWRERKATVVAWFCNCDEPEHRASECRFLRPPIAVREGPFSEESLSGLDVRRLDAKLETRLPRRFSLANGGGGNQGPTNYVVEVALHPPPGMSRGDFAFAHRIVKQKPSERPGYLCLHLRHALLQEGAGGDPATEVRRARLLASFLRALRAGEVADLLREVCELEWMPVLPRDGARFATKSEAFLTPPPESDSPGGFESGGMPGAAANGARQPEGWVLACANAVWGPLELKYDGSLRRSERSNSRASLPCEPRRSRAVADAYAVARFCAQRIEAAVSMAPSVADKIEQAARVVAGEAFWLTSDRTRFLDPENLVNAAFFRRRSYPWLFESRREKSRFHEELETPTDSSSVTDSTAGKLLEEKGDCVGAQFFERNSLSLPAAMFLWALDRRHLSRTVPGSGTHTASPPHHWLAECSGAMNWFAREAGLLDRELPVEDHLSASAFVAYYLFFRMRKALGLRSASTPAQWGAAFSDVGESQRKPSESPFEPASSSSSPPEISQDAVASLSHAQFLLKIACLSSLHPSCDAVQAAASTNRARLHKFALACLGEREDESEPLFLV